MESNWHVLLLGIPLNTEIIINEYLSISPVKTINVFDLAKLGASGFREWSILEPIINNCRSEIKSSDCEISGYDTLNRAWLLYNLLCLRGYTNSLAIACSKTSWKTFSDIHKINQNIEFQGSVLDFHLKLLKIKNSRNDLLKDEDLDWIKNNFDTANDLAHKNINFRLAIEAVIDWRYQNEIRSAIARLWAGIESIFRINSELSFRISLYCANYLNTDSVERRNEFERVKKLYALRSKAVHGAELNDRELDNALNDSYDLLNKLIIKQIENKQVINENVINKILFG